MGVKKVVCIRYTGTEEHDGFEFDHEPVEGTLSIKKTKTGYTARYLVQDDNPQSPEESSMGDRGLFLVGYHRDFWVDCRQEQYNRETGERKVIDPGISKDLAVAIVENDPENSEAQEYRKKYHIFGLEAYIHSGVVLALSREGNFPDRQWDVSRLGLVFVAKTETRSRKKAHKLALGLIAEWNAYLSGDVYGCVREEYNKKKEKLDNLGDSCWGFSGYEYALEELTKI